MTSKWGATETLHGQLSAKYKFIQFRSMRRRGPLSSAGYQTKSRCQRLRWARSCRLDAEQPPPPVSPPRPECPSAAPALHGQRPDPQPAEGRPLATNPCALPDATVGGHSLL